MKFGDHEGDAAVQALVYIGVVEYPNAGLVELSARLSAATALPVTTAWVQRALSQWGWTWRQTRVVTKNKYTEENMERWAVYAELISRTPWNRVSFWHVGCD